MQMFSKLFRNLKALLKFPTCFQSSVSKECVINLVNPTSCPQHNLLKQFMEICEGIKIFNTLNISNAIQAALGFFELHVGFE